jgi:hypothetical protein
MVVAGPALRGKMITICGHGKGAIASEGAACRHSRITVAEVVLAILALLADGVPRTGTRSSPRLPDDIRRTLMRLAVTEQRAKQGRKDTLPWLEPVGCR